MQRRRKGATLALVVVCMLIIIMIGIACFFLAKLFGGGREVANATDAGALNDAKKALTVSVAAPKTPLDMSAYGYPTGNGITLLTYNRCVAAAILVAINAKDEGTSQAVTRATAVVKEVNDLGAALTSAVNGSNDFASVATKNSLKMFGNLGINGAKTPGAYMKPQGATNVYFSTNSLNGENVPMAVSTLTPLNPTQFVVNPTSGYMAGYVPINVTGGTLYGTPVFPQQQPHLVSLYDYNNSTNAYGQAPPNAFEWNSNTKDRMTQSFSGSVACAIVGAVAKGASLGSLGTGFQFPASLPYGYIEFLNWQANPKPPGYDPSSVNAPNIFNQELGWGQTTQIDGDTTDVNTMKNFAFCTTATPPGGNAGTNSLQQWLTWAGSTPGGPTTGSPPSPGTLFIGALNNVALPYDKNNPPTGSSAGTPLYILQTIAQNKINDCTEQLATPPSYGLMGACVPGFGTMLKTFAREVPQQGAQNTTQNFSQVDWAKASVIVAFQGQQMNGAAQTQGQIGTSSSFNRQVDVSLAGSTGVVPDSGIGLYSGYGGSGKRITDPMPPMAVPAPFQMPLEQPGTIWQMMNEVMDPGCLANKVLPEIVTRCQQIQPKATQAQVVQLLNSQPFEMAPHTGTNPSDLTAARMYICLQDQNDPTSQLILTKTQPAHYPGFADMTYGTCSGADCPDGNPPPMNSGPGTKDCYNIDYSLDKTLVDTYNGDPTSNFGDELVHIAPYVDANPA
ncbi:MAG TPA: hypothetical protein V6C72_11995, partial [Chroococcales cyanobacterium]